MKKIKIVHSIVAIIPFIWFMSFLIILICGIISLGYVPKEGDLNDPYKLGLDSLNIFNGIFFAASFIAFFIWIFITLICLLFFRKNFSINRIPTTLFLISVMGFFVFRYLFPQVFGWVLD